jgi:hypothetical protein
MFCAQVWGITYECQLYRFSNSNISKNVRLEKRHVFSSNQGLLELDRVNVKFRVPNKVLECMSGLFCWSMYICNLKEVLLTFSMGPLFLTSIMSNKIVLTSMSTLLDLCIKYVSKSLICVNYVTWLDKSDRPRFIMAIDRTRWTILQVHRPRIEVVCGG